MDTRMRLLSARLQTFQEQFEVSGKRMKWRYTAIPGDLLAHLGMYYAPVVTDGAADNQVCCIYCGGSTGDLQSYRSKRKRKLETIYNVLKAHYEEHSCVNADLIWRYTQKKVIEWTQVPGFSDPFAAEFAKYATMTFQSVPSKFDHNDKHHATVNGCVQAGLINYDISLTNFQDMAKDQERSACFCPYSQSIVILQRELTPIQSHYATCANNQCYFLEKYASNHGDELESLKLLDGKMNSEHNDNADSNDNDVLTLPTSDEGHEESYNSDNANSTRSSIDIDDLNYNPDEDLAMNSEDEKEQDPHVNENENSDENNSKDRKRSLSDEAEIVADESPKRLDIMKADQDQSVNKLSVSPPTKRRRLKRISPVRLSLSNNFSGDDTNNHSDSSEDKEPVINFENHYHRKKGKSRKNQLLDDSIDDFGFSKYGDNAFHIPEPSIPAELQSPKRVQNKSDRSNDISISSSPSKDNNDNGTSSAEFDNKYNNNNTKKLQEEIQTPRVPTSSSKNDNKSEIHNVTENINKDTAECEENVQYSGDESSELDSPQSSVIPSPIKSPSPIASKEGNASPTKETLGFLTSKLAQTPVKLKYNKLRHLY